MTKRRVPPSSARAGLPVPLVLLGGTLAVVVGVVVAMVTSAGGDPPAVAGDIGHIHALTVDPADATLYAGTHHGVFRVSGSGEIARVGESQQDMMGFVAAGPGRFLGSGHPAPGQGGPAHLGLIESTDAARTWSSRSLPGEADFHGLRYRHGTVYGYNSTTATLMSSADLGSWQRLSELALYSFAVSPDDPHLLLAATPHGLVRSTDGGRAWTHAGELSLRLLDWQRTDQLWAVAANGDVYLSANGGETWDRRSGVGGQPAALAAYQDTLYVARADGSIVRSGDRGASWTSLTKPGATA